MTAQRRTRRWRVAAIGLAAGLVLPLAACAGPAQQPQASGPTHITFWNWYQGSDGPTVEALVKKYNESQSKVVVDMTIMPKDTMIQKLLPAYASGDGPTLIAVGHEMTTQYITKKVVQPIDDFYGEGKLDKSLLPKATIDATTYDGKIYGAPMSAAPLMLYYNKTLFAKAGVNPPTTLTELAEAAKKITVYKEGENTTNVYGLAQGMFSGIHSWTAYFRNDGGGYVSEDRKTSILGSPENIKILNYWTNLFRNDHISPIGISVPDAQALFAAGRAGMVIDGPWGAGNYKKSGVDFGVIAFPKGSVTQTTMIVGTPILVAAGIPDAQRQASLDFLKFWNSTESQTTWAVKSGYPPTRSDIPMADLSANPVPEMFTKAVGAESHMRGVVNFQTILDDVVNPAIQKVMNGQGTAEEVLPEASKQLQALLG